MVVVGHAYGSHGGENLGLYPPLIEILQLAARQESILALTGDISRSGSPESFAQIRRELADWSLVLVSPGNHDVGSFEQRSAFKAYFGSTYGSRIVHNTFVLWLDTDLDDWRISGNQLSWLEEELRSDAAAAADAIVVLTHHLIWSRGDRTDFPVNGGPREPNAVRSPDQLQNLLEPLGKPVLVISGDTGAFASQSSLACEQRGRVHYIASGVGGGEQDTFLKVKINGTLDVEVCELETDIRPRCYHE